MPLPKVALNNQGRNFHLASGVLSKNGKTLLCLIIHECSWNKERGFRIMPHKYDHPLCPKCHLFTHNITHKYSLCVWLLSAWLLLRELIWVSRTRSYLHRTINSKDSAAGGGGNKNSIFMKKGQLIKILVNKNAQNFGKSVFFLK